MFPTFFVICTLLCHLVLVPVIAIPLRVIGPQDGSQEEIKRVKTATTDAHAQVLKMQEVAHKASNGDVEALKHVHHAFGNNPNLPAIHGHIQALHDGKYSVQDAHGGHSGMGAYNPNTGHVSFGSAFHSTLTKDHERAGAVLHESSHKILGTKDVWSGSGQPLDKTKPGPGDHIGYADSGLHDIKHAFSPNMHHNADSWRVFGHSCTYGMRRSLTRRAWAEPDLAKRAVILEIRNACALPSAKSKKSAKGNKAHNAAGAHKGTSHATSHTAQHVSPHKAASAHSAHNAQHPAGHKVAAHPKGHNAITHAPAHKAPAHNGHALKLGKGKTAHAAQKVGGKRVAAKAAPAAKKSTHTPKVNKKGKK